MSELKFEYANITRGNIYKYSGIFLIIIIFKIKRQIKSIEHHKTPKYVMLKTFKLGTVL